MTPRPLSTDAEAGEPPNVRLGEMDPTQASKASDQHENLLSFSSSSLLISAKSHVAGAKHSNLIDSCLESKVKPVITLVS